MSTRAARTTHSSAALLLLAACVLTGALLAGCDTTVDLPDDPARAYTMWGSLNPRQDTQTVKVFPLGTQLERIPGGKLPATVTTENLETGQVRTWRDSLVREEDGERAHVFWAPFSPEHGQSYRLQATSEQQGTASATVTVPPEIDLELLGIFTSGGRERMKIHVPAEAPEVLPRAKLLYRVKIGEEQPFADDPTLPQDARLVWEFSVPLQRGEDGWLIERRLDEDARVIDERVGIIRDTLGIPPSDEETCCKLDLVDLHVEVQIVDEAWSLPGDSLSRSSATPPGELSNVENGFGLIGAGYRQRMEIVVPEDIEEQAGFREKF